MYHLNGGPEGAEAKQPAQGQDLNCYRDNHDDSSSELHQEHHPPPPPTTHTCFPNHPGFLWKVISLDKVTSYGKIPRNVLANPVSTIDFVLMPLYQSYLRCPHALQLAATFVLPIFSESQTERNIPTPPFVLSWEWRGGEAWSQGSLVL